MAKLVRLVPLTMLLSLLLIACGQEDDTGGTTATPPATDTGAPTVGTESPTPEEDETPTPSPDTTGTATPTPTGDTAAGSDGATVDVVGVDYAFEGVPASAETGTELTFTNDSDNEVHELVLVRLPGAEERSVEELLQMPPEEQQELLADSVVGVSVAMPGEDGMVVEGDLVLDEPGRYVMVCFVPTGADPEEFMEAAQESQGPPQVEGGAPHVANGMYAELTVEE